MTIQHSLELFEKREVLGVRVARRLHHQRDAMLRGFLDSDDARGVNQVPEPRRIKIENSSSEVHGRVVVEQTARCEVDDRLRDRALPRCRWPVEKEQLHRSFVIA